MTYRPKLAFLVLALGLIACDDDEPAARTGCEATAFRYQNGCVCRRGYVVSNGVCVAGDAGAPGADAH